MNSWKCLLDMARARADRTGQDVSPCFSLVWRRRTCSRAGLPCFTLRDIARQLPSPGNGYSCVKVGCAPRGAHSCPSKRVPWSPGRCVLGQGLCCLPVSALGLPKKLPMTMQGEVVGGRHDPQQARAGQSRPRSCSQESVAWLRASHSFSSTS